jgi:hypothetical protein
VNTSASGLADVKLSRCKRTLARIIEGIETDRLPASDFGGAKKGRVFKPVGRILTGPD